MGLPYRASIERLEDRAQRLPRQSPERVTVYEEAVAIADREGDVRSGWWLRQTLTDVVFDTGQWDRLLPTLEWLLQRADEEPSRFPERTLLWKYKWVVRTVLDLPSVGPERLEAMLLDMEERFARSGASLRAVWGLRAVAALEAGDFEGLRTWSDRYWSAPRDRTCDCISCEHGHRADFLEALGDPALAQRERERLVQSPARCAYVPDGTFSQLLPQLVRRGSLREARKAHRIGYRRVAGRGRLALPQARHLAYAAAVGRMDETSEILTTSWKAGRRQVTPGERFRYDVRCRFAAGRLADAGRSVILPETDEAPSGKVEAGALHAWLDERCREVARAFDGRNGTLRWSQAVVRYGPAVWGVPDASGAVTP